MPPVRKSQPPPRLKGSRAFKLIQKDVLAALESGMFNCDVYDQFKDRFPASLSQFNKYVAKAQAQAKPPTSRPAPSVAIIEPRAPAQTPTVSQAPLAASDPVPNIDTPAPPKRVPLSPAPDAKPRRFQNQTRNLDELF